MTITLPKGWGPATLLIVAYALAAIAGGVVELAQGDMNYTEFLDSLKYAAGATGLLAVGRGYAYGGLGTGFADPQAKKDEGVGK